VWSEAEVALFSHLGTVIHSQCGGKLKYIASSGAVLLEEAALGVPGSAERLAALGESGCDDGLEGVLLVAPPGEDVA
jgi:hypothetical protein